MKTWIPGTTCSCGAVRAFPVSADLVAGAPVGIRAAGGTATIGMHVDLVDGGRAAVLRTAELVHQIVVKDGRTRM